MPSRLSAIGSFLALQKWRATHVNSLPGGWIAYAEMPENQPDITAEEDLVDFEAEVSLNPDRMIRITAKVPVSSDTVGDRVGINIKEGASLLGGDQADVDVADRQYTLTAHALIDGPSAGLHTYKVSVVLGAGSSGPATAHANAGGPSFFLVEDIGPAST